MSPSLYLGIMLLVVFIVTAVSVPFMLTMRCPECGARNWLEARRCRKCDAPFPDEDGNPPTDNSERGNV